jgi:multiple sugar transport system substrate-binding protein
MKKSILLCMLFFLLTACGSTATGSDQQVTLRYSLWDSNQVPAIEKIAAEFKKTHPNVTVQVQVTPADQYFTKLETSATGGSAPDVFWVNSDHFPKWAAGEILTPLDDYIKADNYDLTKIPDSLVNLYKFEDKHYALAKDFDTIGLWYNKQMFDAAGMKYPDETWDWKTLHEAARKLTNPAKGQWGIVAPEVDQEGFYNTIFQAGGYIISGDGKTSGFDKPETIEGLKFWTDLIQDKSSPTYAQMSDTPPISLFESGKVAMMYGGSWQAIEFSKNEFTKDKVDVALLPKGKQRATVIHGMGNAIYANTPHKQEAWEFLKFLVSKRGAEIQAESGAVISSYEGTQDLWVKSTPKFHLQIFIDELAYSYPYPTSKNTQAWLEVQNKILGDAWLGKISAEQAGKQIAQKMNALLAEEG